MYSNGAIASSDQNVVLGEYSYSGPGLDGVTPVYQQSGGGMLYMFFYPIDGVGTRLYKYFLQQYSLAVLC